MTKKKIDVLDYSSKILKALSKGVLLTVKDDEKVNTMVISWGALGIEWNKVLFTTYIRENRYTKAILDKALNFTINIPLEKMDTKVFGIAGTKSGRNIDKIKEANLTLVDSEIVSSPAIKELPITLECKVLLSLSTVISILNLSSPFKSSLFVNDWNFNLSIASLALDINSLKNISLFV